MSEQKTRGFTIEPKRPHPRELLGLSAEAQIYLRNLGPMDGAPLFDPEPDDVTHSNLACPQRNPDAEREAP